jgi:hypothetical protein
VCVFECGSHGFKADFMASTSSFSLEPMDTVIRLRSNKGVDLVRCVWQNEECRDCKDDREETLKEKDPLPAMHFTNAFIFSITAVKKAGEDPTCSSS